MNEKVHGNDYWMTMVYIDSYEDNILRGCFSNPFINSWQNFTSLSDFIIKMELMMDMMELPQSYAANRRFSTGPSDKLCKPTGIMRRGNKATFSLTIRFRRNNSWQGTLSWLETKYEQNFRSVLELIVMMDSALRKEHFPTETKDSAAIG
jgi:hypothetical protein